MPSAYTTNNGIELIGTGEQSGTWGGTTNNNLTFIDTSLDGHLSVTLASAGSSGSPNTLPITDGSASNGRNRAIIFTDGGDLGADAYVQLTPNDAKKIMFVRNSLSGSRNLILFQGTYNASNDFVLAAGKDAIVKFDGAGAGAVASAVLADLALDAATIGTLAATTINATTVNATTFDMTNLEVTNIKAKDGTASATIADSTGVMTIGSSVLTTADINGGSVDGVTLGTNSAVTEAQIDNININGNTISSTDANGNIVLAPNGTGDVQLDADTVRVGDSNADVTVTTNGTGDLILNTNAGTNSGIIRIYDGASGNIALTPNGTGEVDISKVDIDGGTIDGVTIGAASAGAGTFTTLTATGDVDIADKIVHSGDTNTAIRFPAADTVTVETSGAERLRVDSSGNVGIGTSDPATLGGGSKLTVNQGADGNIVFARGGSTRQVQLGTSSTMGYINADNTSGGLGFNVNATERMRIDASGNLGLGVTPSAWHVNFKAIQAGNYSSFVGDNSNGYTEVLNNAYASGASTFNYSASLAATRYSQQLGSHKWFIAGAGSTGNAITFTQAMTLDASGNLGVGTTSPATKLDVNGSVLSTGLTTDGTGAAGFDVQSNRANSGQARASFYVFGPNNTTSYQALRANYAGIYSAHADIALNADTSKTIQFWTGGSERARIDASGNLLVGTTSGATNRFIKDSSGGIALQVANSSTTNTSSAMELNVNYTGGTNGWFVRGGDNAIYRFYIYSNGDMANSNNSYGAISDAKVKENITDATPKLDKLCQVRVINYNLIGDEKKQIGVIAQELEQIFPSMVEETPDRDAEGNELGTTTKSVKYSVFVPMLIKAMQEQQAIITALEARVTALEA